MEAVMRKPLALSVLFITAALLAGCVSDRVYYYPAYPAVSNVAPPLPQAPGGPCKGGEINEGWDAKKKKWICVKPSPRPVLVPATIYTPVYWYGWYGPGWYYGPRYYRRY